MFEVGSNHYLALKNDWTVRAEAVNSLTAGMMPAVVAPMAASAVEVAHAMAEVELAPKDCWQLEDLSAM